MIVLDTDVLIEILDKASTKGEGALNAITASHERPVTTALSLHETLYGLNKYAKPTSTVLQFPALSYTKNDAVLSARIELEAEQDGRPTRRTDAMIAATTINNGASLFTFNRRHFQQLAKSGLKLFPHP